MDAPAYDPPLDFGPVPRKFRIVRGWTAAKQRRFIAAGARRLAVVFGVTLA